MTRGALDAEQDAEQSRALLDDGDGEETNEQETPITTLTSVAVPEASSGRPQRPGLPTIRHPSLLKTSNGSPRIPRTPNRVRFDIEDEPDSGGDHGQIPNGNARREQMDFQDMSPRDSDDGLRSSTGQRLPLLTDIQAPSVTVADDWDFNAEDYLETARPKSGMRSAFMNMANSIM